MLRKLSLKSSSMSSVKNATISTRSREICGWSHPVRSMNIDCSNSSDSSSKSVSGERPSK